MEHPSQAFLQASLHSAHLRYGGGLVLHTAASGSVGQLEALYLRLVEDGQSGIGEVRTNIAYLNGIEPEAVVREAVAALETIDWRLGSQTLVQTAGDWLPAFSAPVRMLIDIALQDLRARRAGVSVASLFGAGDCGVPTWRSNQTLFWSSDEAMLTRAGSYLERGFSDLKLRVGIGEFSDDLRRIDLLRQRYGDRVTLSADANGQWQPDECAERLDALAERGLDYIEQPIVAGNWEAIARIVETSPLIVMLDESLQSSADIDSLCALAGAPVAAHLKLVKLGGIAATVAAARRLTASGIPIMIGQMNEGAAATAAALQVCCATAPRWAELYGADGLLNDPVSGLAYGAGTVSVQVREGLGVSFASRGTQPILSIQEN